MVSGLTHWWINLTTIRGRGNIGSIVGADREVKGRKKGRKKGTLYLLQCDSVGSWCWTMWASAIHQNMVNSCMYANRKYVTMNKCKEYMPVCRFMNNNEKCLDFISNLSPGSHLKTFAYEGKTKEINRVGRLQVGVGLSLSQDLDRMASVAAAGCITSLLHKVV